MTPETVALLRSPISQEALRLASGPGGEDLLEGVDTGKRFPIVDGIPQLIDQSLVVDYNKRYQGFYNFVAPFYDATVALGARFIGSAEGQIRMEYIDDLELKPGDRFLEISIGTGANIQYLPREITCYGLDISSAMLKRCRRNLKRWNREAELFLGIAEALPFKDARFDCDFTSAGSMRSTIARRRWKK